MTSREEHARPDDLTLRPATEEDVDPVADILWTSRLECYPAMPTSLHTAEEGPAFITERLAESEVWVAELGGTVIGFAIVDGDWLHSLYVHPRAAGLGVGTALIELVKGLRPDGFALWVFESNEPARRLYRSLGFVELEHTDGSTNEERERDLRMAWTGRDPVAYLRGAIDGVDDELACLVSRRAALTAAMQSHKATPGHVGRDRDRELEIAQRLAEKTPEIDVEAWQRILEALITIGLDAAKAP